MTTVREELAAASESLAEVGCDSPRLDAELLLARVLSTDRAGLVIASEEEVSGDDRTRYLALLTRRVKREPIAYITGKRAFRRLTLAVDPRVLIPRPETELLVEVGLGLPGAARVADIGTGSGAVALALKDERADLHVIGVDCSQGALAVARLNASRLRLEVEWWLGDLLEDVRATAVLANLPYVVEGAELPPEIRLYEPTAALYAGPDGLDVIRRLVAQSGERDELTLVALEVGEGQADEVASLLAGAGFAQVKCLRDLAGIQRVVVARR
ncbi:MAG: peptide chain release factor N(5)-glutamine methyltransferase [Solirubrobacteraceae bacterium]